MRLIDRQQVARAIAVFLCVGAVTGCAPRELWPPLTPLPPLPEDKITVPDSLLEKPLEDELTP
ncbi:MAG: hypothetical protein K0U36_01105 [Alphaproteobacteria bacterium]|nr:hypothetical protein [Alphaproteobacteria bacterium]